MTDTSGVSETSLPTPVLSQAVAVPSVSSGSKAQPIDIVSTIKAGVQNLQDKLAGIAGEAQGAVNSAIGANNEAKTANLGAAGATSAIESMKASADSKRDADNALTNANMGVTPGAASYMGAMVRDSILPRFTELVKNETELEQMKSVGPFDDFMGFVKNAFLMPTKEATVEQQSKDLMGNLNIANSVTSLASATHAVNATSDVVDATAVAAEQSKIATDKAIVENAKLQDSSATLGITAAQISMTASNEAMELNFKYLDAQGKQNKDSYDGAAADANIAYRNAQTAQDNMRVKLEQGTEDDRNAMMALITAQGKSKLGIDIPNYQAWKSIKKDQQDIILDIASSSVLGMNSLDPLSPTRALDKLINVGTNGPSPGAAYTVQKLRDFAVGVDNDPKYIGVNHVEKTPLLDQAIQNGISNELNTYIPTKGGLFSPFTFDKTATTNPIVSNLPIIKEMVAGGLGKDGLTPTDLTDFMAQGANMMRRGYTAADVAKQIATTFQNVSGNLAQVRRYDLFPMASRPVGPGQPYRMQVHAPPGLERIGLPGVVDGNNPAAIQNYLTKLTIGQRTQAVTGGGNSLYVHE